MNADWRVTVRLDGKSRGSRAILHGQVADGLRARLDGRADVSADGYRLFVYTQTEALAGEAEQAALQLAGEHGLAPQITLDRWDADASEWQSGAGPASGPEWAAGKHAREVAEDARRSEATGVPQWTVRVTLASRQDATRLSGWLQSVGIPAVRSRKWVLLGAADEDVARELERLTAEQAPGAHVLVARNMKATTQNDWSYLPL